MLPFHLLALLPLVSRVVSEQKSSKLLGERDAEPTERMYIVATKRDSQADVDSLISLIAVKPDQTYDYAIRGFAARLTEEQKKKLEKDSRVAYVSLDREITNPSRIKDELKGSSTYTEKELKLSTREMTTETKSRNSKRKRFQRLRFRPKIGDMRKKIQRNAPWGLARLSHERPRHTSYHYFTNAGAGVCVYVIDSGLDQSHPEFGGRARLVRNFSTDESSRDFHGYGTHVAGIVGSATYGVAKKAKIFGVKVVNRNKAARLSRIIAAMNFVIGDAAARREECYYGVVANMPIFTEFSQPINEAAQRMVKSNIFLAVAAGDDERNARLASPASEFHACTAGATDKKDVFASFSNWGSMLNVLAPGVNIMSTTPGGGTTIASGTSQASAHLAGLGAYLMSIGQSTSHLCDSIAQIAVKDAVRWTSPTTPNLLINNGFR
ncbi:hypothetical protein QQS21_000651 [Conoideocrella luteorostrata]|uniref:Uncharacterized protein n=1 Tax=Conoideocrella luteorostrata TaxID=1105319 RepID=A0AAJ0D1I8_9HYPO|nr:hypothetical protein QQS21_000651 [Conoideocrella luteorostrata]